MKEFIEKLIGRLEEKAIEHRETGFEMERKGFSNIADKQYAKQTTYLNAIEIVNQLAEEYGKDKNVRSNGWIPCSDRLPERTKPIQTEEYTVTMRKITRVGKCSPFSSHASFDYESGKWLVKGFEVIAWQPLPEPFTPKEGRE